MSRVYTNLIRPYSGYSVGVTGSLVVSGSGPNGPGTPAMDDVALLVYGDISASGKITAHEYHTQTVSASILYESGSSKFGNTSDDRHEFTGSISHSGSLHIQGDITASGDISASGDIYGLEGFFTDITASGGVTASHFEAGEQITVGKRGPGTAAAMWEGTAGTTISSSQLTARKLVFNNNNTNTGHDLEIRSGQKEQVGMPAHVLSEGDLTIALDRAGTYGAGRFRIHRGAASEEAGNSTTLAVDISTEAITASGHISASGTGSFNSILSGQPGSGHTTINQEQIRISLADQSNTAIFLQGTNEKGVLTIYGGTTPGTYLEPFNNNYILSNASSQKFHLGVGILYGEAMSSTLTVAGDIYATGSVSSSGNITASNHISASHNIYATDYYVGNTQFTDETSIANQFAIGINYTGALRLANITASGNLKATHISASGDFYAGGNIVGDDATNISKINELIFKNGEKIYNDVDELITIQAADGLMISAPDQGLGGAAVLTLSSSDPSVTTGQGFGQINFGNIDANGSTAGIWAKATQTQTSTARGTSLLFKVTEQGDNTYKTALELDINTGAWFTGSITASADITASGTITGLSGSFSHILGNSPITVRDAITFQSHVTMSGHITASGNIIAKEISASHAISASLIECTTGSFGHVTASKITAHYFSSSQAAEGYGISARSASIAFLTGPAAQNGSAISLINSNIVLNARREDEDIKMSYGSSADSTKFHMQGSDGNICIGGLNPTKAGLHVKTEAYFTHTITSSFGGTLPGAVMFSGSSGVVARDYITETQTIAAAGSGLGDYTAISNSDGSVVFVTGADGTKGIKLPTIAAIPTNTNRIGRRIEVYNLTTDQNLIIHPGGTKQRIIGLNVNTAMTLAGGGSCVFTVLSGSTYVGREAGAPS